MEMEHKLDGTQVKYGYIWWDAKWTDKYEQVFPKERFTIDLHGKRLLGKKVDWKRRRISLGKNPMEELFQRGDIVSISKSSDGTVVVKKKGGELKLHPQVDVDPSLVKDLEAARRNSENPENESTIVEFKHKVTQSEIDSKYLNLKDEANRKYGDRFPPHATKLAIIDQERRRFLASKHHEHQIWGNLRTWYEANQIITSGTIISVKYDSAERANEGEPIIHLEVIESHSTSIVVHGEEETTEEERGTEIPIEFERQLENFIEANLGLIERDLRLFIDESGSRGRQYPTDIGTIDLLCVRPNSDFVIIELKRGRGSDRVVGQISRYMGWVKRHLANDHNVYGIIITHEYDPRLSYAIAANNKLKMLYYKIRLEFVSEEEIQGSG